MATTIPKPPPRKDIKWLNELNGFIWEDRIDPNCGRKWSGKKRPLSKDEHERLFALIEKYSMICVLWDAFGFNLGMRVFAHPNTVGEKPSFLVSISHDHVKPHVAGEFHFDEQWKYFSPFTHSNANRRALKFYGVGEAKKKQAYEY